jgi:hypothetical protein
MTLLGHSYNSNMKKLHLWKVPNVVLNMIILIISTLGSCFIFLSFSHFSWILEDENFTSLSFLNLCWEFLSLWWKAFLTCYSWESSCVKFSFSLTLLFFFLWNDNRISICFIFTRRKNWVFFCQSWCNSRCHSWLLLFHFLNKLFYSSRCFSHTCCLFCFFKKYVIFSLC